MRNDGVRELKEAVEGEFALIWQVSEAGYRWVDRAEYEADAQAPAIDEPGPWLVEAGTGGIAGGQPQLRQYAPLTDEPTLYRKFAETPPTKEGVLEFARQCGRLGRSCWLWYGRGTAGRIAAAGESFDRWHTEIQRMQRLLQLWDLIQVEDFGRLGMLIVWDPGGSHVSYRPTSLEATEEGRQQTIVEVIARREQNPRLLSLWERGELLNPAKYYLAMQLNGLLAKYVSPRALPLLHLPTEEDRGMATYHFPQDLLSAIHLQLFLEVTGQKHVRRCKACGEWFDVTGRRSDVKYCSPACRNRVYRQRRGVAAV